MLCHVLVYTGDKPLAGTDANVKLILHDDQKTQSPEFKLDVLLRDDFEKGNVDDFNIEIPADLKFGQLKKLEFWRDDFGVFPAWYVDRISVEIGKDHFDFPVFRWIKAKHHYLIQHLDTSLPQFDEHKQQRRMELEEKREVYKLRVKVPGLTAQVAEMPCDEHFSIDYRWDLKKLKYKLAFETLKIRLKSGSWKDLDSLTNIFISNHLPEPQSTRVWKEDSHFGDERVAGVNPVLLKLCTTIPDKFGVTDEMVSPFLEGMDLKQAIFSKRLFIIDLEITEGMPCSSEEFVVCSPIALFFETKSKQLLPVAIQLWQTKGPTNPVFLPSDPPLTWLLVKMWYSNADSAYHQSLTHLGFTHLLMEGVSVITHRNLSQSHPIFKLLAPHFLYLIAINTLAVEKLLCPGGWVDSVQNIGVKGFFHLIRQGIKTWRMDVDGTIPAEIQSRGLLDDDVLSFYPYREDALLVYAAIKSYVTCYVNLYYNTLEKLTEDYEIQAWAKELVKPRDKGGCGILGVPGNGCFSFNGDLILVLTSVIATCSLAHAASNFPQYDSYGFSPNNPLMMRGRPPTDKSARTEEDIIATLADKRTTMNMLIIMSLLSQKSTKSLGDFEVNYVFEPQALDIISKFREVLASVSQVIKERNKSRRVPYEWIDPEIIPNSIGI